VFDIRRDRRCLRPEHLAGSGVIDVVSSQMGSDLAGKTHYQTAGRRPTQVYRRSVTDRLFCALSSPRLRAKDLPKPKVISDATNAWQRELDRLSAYMDEYTDKATDAEAYVPNKVLYEAYKSWCESNCERVLSQLRFTGQLEAMGYRKERKEEGNIWRGIRFKRLEGCGSCRRFPNTPYTRVVSFFCC
jgi:hypothetical protein